MVSVIKTIGKYVNPFVSGFFLIHILQGVGFFFDENEMLQNKSPIIYDILLSTNMLNILYNIIHTPLHMLCVHIYIHVYFVTHASWVDKHGLGEPWYIRRHPLPGE